MSNTRTPPLGIAIICIVWGLLAVAGIFGAWRVGGPDSLLGAFWLVVHVASVPVIWGLWRIVPVAWSITVAYFCLVLARHLVRVFTGDPLGGILSILINGLILQYVYSYRDLYRANSST
ncbi:hypothetical protein [Haloarchaeobius sp. DFWS5]|uniref:hypothetical protein n=1 Tax=Haloarchaeobius sp. DFWS5 TaxID=3446114 RepID=UPI003EBF7ED3